MDVTNGNYYRRKEDGATVKVLYSEVYPYKCSCGALGCYCLATSGIIYRLDEDEYPHRREFISAIDFLNDFEEMEGLMKPTPPPNRKAKQGVPPPEKT